MTPSVRSSAATASDNPVLEAGARLGYVASGVVHLLIAWVAVQLAWFGSGGDADQTGALQALGDTGLGALPLWLAVAGFGLLGVWQVVEAVLQRDAATRAKAAGKGVAYLALTWTTVAVILGTGSSSSEQSADLTATVMSKPFGVVLIAGLGLAVVGIGGYHVVKGWRRSFLEDLRQHPPRQVVHAGRFGYIAKGLALVVVGGLFIQAAVTHDAQEAQCLDGALRAVLDAPFGPVLLTLVALGLAAFGAYSIARSRYAKV
ncbi:DUF1206 domain-containing protein [Pengzhenrongella sicca]|uniref:DUF1206 domain-containing protein n=1 Tax=Pengzhenrongella sicca TaxID=2819238 RepID=A0A8A4ZHP4_9MICO|nr:DUF1206 domain-containing protein [Pengzhenrongella sicca]QTE30911.1 DUF1206 domain-containing protein [Pengzhenrongella sicca]